MPRFLGTYDELRDWPTRVQSLWAYLSLTPLRRAMLDDSCKGPDPKHSTATAIPFHSSRATYPT